MFIVSACLAGVPCRYNGEARGDPGIMELVSRGKALCICPERMGGLPTPRLPAEIRGGDGTDVLCGRARVVDCEGRDVSAAFVQGARAALAAAQAVGATEAVLKAHSPSCGAGCIYDGTFSGALRPGDGVTAALFQRSGIRIQTR